MEDLQNAVFLEELWADSDVDAATLAQSFDNVTMTFNTEDGSVSVVSEMRTDMGLPMFEWKMTPATGEIIQISRTKDGRSEKTINKDVDPAELTAAPVNEQPASYGGSLSKLL